VNTKEVGYMLTDSGVFVSAAYAFRTFLGGISW